MLAFETQLSKLADFCGFKEPGERGLDPMQELKKAMMQDTGGAVPLSNCLLYDYFDDKTNIAFNKGSLGFFMEVNPLVGSESSIEKNLTLFFNDELTAGGHLQFIVVASHNVDQVLNKWERERKYGGEELAMLTYYRRHFIEKAALDYSNAQDGRLARNFRTFVSYSCSDKGETALDKTVKFKRKLYNKLKAENFSPRLCGSSELIDIASEILQMKLGKKDPAKYDILNDISSQILKNNDSTVCEDKIIHHDSKLVSKVLAPTELPSSFSLVEMINLLGNEDKAIPGRFVICYSLANDIGAKGTSTILARGDRVIAASTKAYTKNDLLAKEEASKWVQVKAINKKGEIFLRESMLVMITAPKEDIETAEEVIKSLYNAHDWKLAICDKIQRIASLAILPMMASSYIGMLKFFRLTRYALSGDVVAKLPLQGEWKGVPSSGVILMGRRGQLFLFDPFHRVGGGGNYNVIIMAPPGSGKSFLAQEIIESMLTKNVSVFVMDIGASYKNIAHLLGKQSEMVSFNKDSNISLNPFSGLSSSGAIYVKALEMLQKGKNSTEISAITGLSEEQIEALKIGKSKIAEDIKEKEGIEILEVPAREGTRKHFVTKDSIIYAKSMISAMCGVSGDGRAEAIVERAIMLGISEHGDKLDITKMAEILSNLKNRKGEPVEGASAMADSIYSYTEEGMHARFFGRGQKDATFKEMLTVFELEELVDDEALLAVVLQVVLMQITMQFLCGDRTRRFMLVVDEAWRILDYAANFLERFARTVRKYGGSLVVCTQDLSSFDNKCGTRKSQAAVLECSTWKLIMAQQEEGLEAFAASKAYEKYIDLIGSVRKCSSNKFSEVLISTNGVNVVGRLAVDPYSTALFSTEDKDFAYLLQKEKEGYSKHEAIIALSQKYGELPDLPKEMKIKTNEV